MKKWETKKLHDTVSLGLSSISDRGARAFAAIVLGASPDGDPYESPLISACQKGDVLVAAALIKLGASVNATDYCTETPLVKAIWFKPSSIELLRLLLENGATIDRQSGDRGTLLHLAVEAGNADAISVLIEYGVNPLELDSKGRTAAQLARQEGKHRLAQIIEAKTNEIGNSR